LDAVADEQDVDLSQVHSVDLFQEDHLVNYGDEVEVGDDDDLVGDDEPAAAVVVVAGYEWEASPT